MNLDDAILAERADTPLAPCAADNAKLGQIIGESFTAEKFLTLLAIVGACCITHSGEAIFEERYLKKVFHRFQELSPASPQIYQQKLTAIMALLFGISGKLA